MHRVGVEEAIGKSSSSFFPHAVDLGLSALDIASTQAQLAAAECQRIEASIAGNAADSRAATAVGDEARVQATKLSETLPMLDERIAAKEALLAKGLSRNCASSKCGDSALSRGAIAMQLSR